jgi:hypothetical protein
LISLSSPETAKIELVDSVYNQIAFAYCCSSQQRACTRRAKRKWKAAIKNHRRDIYRETLYKKYNELFIDVKKKVNTR